MQKGNFKGASNPQTLNIDKIDPGFNRGCQEERVSGHFPGKQPPEKNSQDIRSEVRSKVTGKTKIRNKIR